MDLEEEEECINFYDAFIKAFVIKVLNTMIYYTKNDLHITHDVNRICRVFVSKELNKYTRGRACERAKNNDMKHHIDNVVKTTNNYIGLFNETNERYFRLFIIQERTH